MPSDEQTAVVESSPTEIIAALSPEQYDKWKLTGNLPEPPKKEVAAPSEPPAKEAKSEVAPEKATEPPVSEPGKTQESTEHKESGAEKRIKQLLSRNKELQDQLAKAQPAEKGVAVAVPPAEKPGARVEAAQEPTPEAYETYEEYVRALTDHRIASAIKADREAQAKAAKQVEIEKQNQVIAEGWQKRVAEATKRHPDFVEVALDTTLPIPVGSVIDAFLLESESGSEVLYHLGQNPDEITRIAALKPIAQARELVKIELTLSGQPIPPARKITSAPPPPTEVSGKATAPADEAAAALERGDFASYRRTMNARELTSQKG